MHQLAFTKKFLRLADVGVVDKTKDVVVGHACLLLTYAEDKEKVKLAIKKLIDDGVYPYALWK